MRAVSAPFGPHSDAEWRFLTEHVVRKNPDGSFRMHYDPSLALAFNAPAPDQGRGALGCSTTTSAARRWSCAASART